MTAQVPSLHFLLPSGFSQWPRVSLQCTLRCQSCNRPVSSRSNEAKKTYFQRRPYYYNVVSSTIPVVIILDRRPYKASLVGALICSLSSYWNRFSLVSGLDRLGGRGLIGQIFATVVPTRRRAAGRASLRPVDLPVACFPVSVWAVGSAIYTGGGFGLSTPLFLVLLVRLYGEFALRSRRIHRTVLTRCAVGAALANSTGRDRSGG